MPSTAVRIRSQTFQTPPKQILSILSSQMEAKLSFQKKKKSVTATHKLMVTPSLLQIPNTEALKEILSLPYHVHLPALQGEKNKQLLKNLKQKKVVLYPKTNKCCLFSIETSLPTKTTTTKSSKHSDKRKSKKENKAKKSQIFNHGSIDLRRNSMKHSNGLLLLLSSPLLHASLSTCTQLV